MTTGARRRVATVCVLTCVIAAAAHAQDTLSKPFDEAATMTRLRADIAGKEELASVDVFKNIQYYKGVTAGRLLRIMELGFSRSLGVTCTHCHDVDQFDADTKTTKQVAREMSMMVEYINTERLKKIPGLRSTNPSINCTTCHRGQTRPSLALPQSGSPARPPQR